MGIDAALKVGTIHADCQGKKPGLWCSACGEPIECTPVSPTPKHKLEAGCQVQRTDGEFCDQPWEVISVSGECVLVQEGALRKSIHSSAVLQVTAPATPEVDDYVSGIGTRCQRSLGIIRAVGLNGSDLHTIQWPDGNRSNCLRSQITIIAKARHARELV